MSVSLRHSLSLAVIVLVAFGAGLQLRPQSAGARGALAAPHVTIVFPTKTPKPTSTPRSTPLPRPTKTSNPPGGPRPTRTPTVTRTPLPQSLAVTTTSDSALCPAGPGSPGYSLRCAITQVDHGNSGRTIVFAIPASDPGCHSATISGKATDVCTISPTHSLPTLTASSIIIDGYSQAGALPNAGAALSSGDNAVMSVRLDGAAGPGNGITVSHATGDTIRGVSITNFHTGVGISVDASSHIVIAGNLIGVAPDGSSSGNKVGISLTATSDSTVGGSSAADRNSVSANAVNGIIVTKGTNALIAGNLIGTDVRGTGAMRNGVGVAFFDVSTSTVGGAESAVANVISGNRGDGVALKDGNGNEVTGNIIGADGSGKNALGNQGTGVSVGGRESAAAVVQNVIAHNRGDGIWVGQSGPQHSNSALLRRNLVFANTQLGIDIAPVGVRNCSVTMKAQAGLTGCPVIETVSAEQATGTACKGCTVELYVAASGIKDRGFGEGKKFLGSAIARNGTWQIPIHARFNPSTQQVTATATRLNTPQATSQFALDMPVRVSFQYLTAHLVKVHQSATKHRRARTLVVGIKIDWRPNGQTSIAGYNVFLGGRQLNAHLINATPIGAYDFESRFPAQSKVTGKLVLDIKLLNGLTIHVPFGPAH